MSDIVMRGIFGLLIGFAILCICTEAFVLGFMYRAAPTILSYTNGACDKSTCAFSTSRCSVDGGKTWWTARNDHSCHIEDAP